MCTIKTSKALKLKRYIYSITDFEYIEPDICPYNNHVGALLTDIILQAGINYNRIVFPRVVSLLQRFPNAVTLRDFVTLIDSYGLENLLNWRDTEKINRMSDLINFLLSHEINTVQDLIAFVSYKDHLNMLKTIRGIGNKTCDYLLKLLGFDIVAVDRHIKSFIEDAAIDYKDYFDIQLIVSYTADFLKISRRCLDYSIWHYQSRKL